MVENYKLLEIMETISHIIDDHVLVCNLDGKVIYSNNSMERHLAYKDNELEDKYFLDLLDKSYIDKGKSFLHGASKEPSPWKEFLFIGKKTLVKLHIRIFEKNNLLYIFGNEKYMEYEVMKEKKDREMINAIKIHKRSLPDSLPKTRKISFDSIYIPAQKLGGDLFDAFKVDNGLLNDYFEQYVCFVADVSGHGLDSAMLSIFVKDTIDSYFRLKHTPGQVLSPKEIINFFLQHYVKEGYPMEYLVCLFFVVFDLRTMELTYCNAGFHMCPILVVDKKNIIELNQSGMPVSTAISPALYNYKDHTIDLSPEMTLFVMSDGLPEQRTSKGFYEERLKRLISEIHEESPEDIVKNIRQDFDGFLKDESISDDITLVVAKLTTNEGQKNKEGN